MTPSPRSGESGIVLIIVLWIIVVLTAVALSYSYMAKVDYQVVKYYANSVKAEYLARAGLSRAIIMLREDLLKDIDDAAYDKRELIIDVDDDDRWEYDALGEAWSANPDFYESVRMKFETADAILEGSFTVRVEDEASKLDLNLDRVDAEILRQLMVLLGLDEDDAGPVASAIVDWRDRDDQPTLLDEEIDESGDQDTEGTYYNPHQSQADIDEFGPDYVNKNSSIDYLEELLLVKGVTPHILYGDEPETGRRTGTSSRRGSRNRYPGLRDYVTCYNANPAFGFNGRMNLNTLKFEPLAALLILIRDQKEAETLAGDILDYRLGADRKPGTRDDKPMRTYNDNDGDSAHFTEIRDFTQDDLNRLARWRLTGVTSDTFTVISTGEMDGVRKTYRAIIRRDYIAPDTIDYEAYDEEGEPIPELARVRVVAFQEEG